MRQLGHKQSYSYQEIVHESTLGHGLTYDASVRRFILCTGQVHTLQPLCLCKDIVGVEEWTYVKAREEVIVLGSNIISSSGGFFAYSVV